MNKRSEDLGNLKCVRRKERGWGGWGRRRRERGPRELVLSAPSRGSALLSYVFETEELSREVRKRCVGGRVYQNL